MIFNDDPQVTRKRMRGRGPGGLFNPQGIRELSVNSSYNPIETRNIPYNGYQAVESSYMANSIGYSRGKLLVEGSDIPGELMPGDVLDVAVNLKTGESKIEKVSDTDRAKIEQAIAEITGSDAVTGDRQFTERSPAQDGMEIQDNSSEIQQKAYAITYEMIADRAAANDTALQELDTEGILDHNSNPDLEGILDANQVDDKLMDAIHELGIDSVDDSVPGEDEPEYAEVLEYGGW